MVIQVDKDKEGLKTAISELHDPSAPVPGDDAEQLQLPALPLPLDTPGEVAAARGPGRPPGSKNKNTEEWRKFLLSKYRSPLEALGQTYSMTLDELAVRLGVRPEQVQLLTLDQRMDLFKLQLMSAKELAPYVHQKMPLAVEGGEGGLIQLVINQAQATTQVGENAGAEAFTILNEQDEENQLVTDSDFTESNNSQSNKKGE